MWKAALGRPSSEARSLASQLTNCGGASFEPLCASAANKIQSPRCPNAHGTVLFQKC
ncbi:MAG: hypothetical protein QOF56_3295 [Acidobacteriaceae bacterium]|nr:hypothetical protein [Acidobacteriaceae bacterium]